MSVRFEFSGAMYRARTKRKLTQEESAEIFEISNRWYQKLEKGIAEPKITLACKIAKEFDIDLNEIAGIKKDDKIQNEERLVGQRR